VLYCNKGWVLWMSVFINKSFILWRSWTHIWVGFRRNEPSRTGEAFMLWALRHFFIDRVGWKKSNWEWFDYKLEVLKSCWSQAVTAKDLIGW
jgi:hypothetical protein